MKWGLCVSNHQNQMTLHVPNNTKEPTGKTIIKTKRSIQFKETQKCYEKIGD